MSEPMKTNAFREIPQVKTCETCDWWCYGTWASNTCDKWETTLWETEVPDDLIARLLNMPTEADIEKMMAEAEAVKHGRAE